MELSSFRSGDDELFRPLISITLEMECSNQYLSDDGEVVLAALCIS